MTILTHTTTRKGIYNRKERRRETIYLYLDVCVRRVGVMEWNC